MKKSVTFSVFVLLCTASILAQSLTTPILPQYIEGSTSTNTNRLPFVYRATLTGLLPNATYRYTNQIVISTDAATQAGSGNCLYVSLTGDFTRTTSPSLSTAGGYSTFTTDAAGSFTGWFANEPTGNARFVPGKYVFMRINLNDGGTGTSATTRLTTTDSVRVAKLDTLSSDSTGTAVRCNSDFSAKDFVFLYDNTSGTGRPVCGTFVESDGTDNSTTNSYAAFYANSVNTVAGAFGTILPNKLANGIRCIERRGLADGAKKFSVTSTNGIWGANVSTVNPRGGVTEIVLPAISSSVPVELSSCTYAFSKAGVLELKWTTKSEKNNQGFQVFRAKTTDGVYTLVSSTIILGHGTTLLSNQYSFSDPTYNTGFSSYRIRQIDFDGTYHDYAPLQIASNNGTASSLVVEQNYPNPYNPTTTIRYSLPEASNVTVKIYNTMGQEVLLYAIGQQQSGSHYININASGLSSGIYFYKLITNSASITKRMIVLK
ncbi:MAG: T9SS type A sorting domain-containing protein [Ignavibacteria bacterium]|nr:T9SS type A sorting domain-containing protein [Ignavibacteria bacterium]